MAQSLIVPENWHPVAADELGQNVQPDKKLRALDVAQRAAPTLGIDTRPLDLAQRVAPSLGIDLTAPRTAADTPAKGEDITAEHEALATKAAPLLGINPMISKAPQEGKPRAFGKTYQGTGEPVTTGVGRVAGAILGGARANEPLGMGYEGPAEQETQRAFGYGTPQYHAAETIIRPIATVGDLISRIIGGGVGGAGQVAEELQRAIAGEGEAVPGAIGRPEQLNAEIQNLLGMKLAEGPGARAKAPGVDYPGPRPPLEGDIMPPRAEPSVPQLGAPGRTIEGEPVPSRAQGVQAAQREAQRVKQEMQTTPGEPPIQSGMVRLYRGETGQVGGEKTPSSAPDWVTQNPEYQGMLGATGRWFSDNKAAADYYVKQHGGADAHVTYVDVPAEKANSFLSSNQPEAARWSAAGRATEEYFVPRDVADARRPIAEGQAQPVQPWQAKDYSLKLPPPKTAPLPDASSLQRPEADWHARVSDLDARNAPDSEYRAILSTGAKETLKSGAPRDAPSWRDKVVGVINKSVDPAHDLARQAAPELNVPPPEAARPVDHAKIASDVLGWAGGDRKLAIDSLQQEIAAGRHMTEDDNGASVDLRSVMQELQAPSRAAEAPPPGKPPTAPPPEPPSPPPGGDIPPSEVPKTTVMEMEDDLHRLKSNEQADQSELRKVAETLPADVKARDEELYHVGENAPLQRTDPHFREHGVPLAREEKVLIDRLRELTGDKELRYDPEYMHRQVQGETPRMDEAIGMDEAIPYKGQRKSLSTQTSSNKRRSVFAIEDPQGNRKVVTHAPDEGVLAWEGGRPTRIGSTASLHPGTEFVDANGKVQKVVQAKTAEIEAHTNIVYHKSFFGSKLTNIANLRKAVRNAEFLDKWKNSDAFRQFSMPAEAEKRPSIGHNQPPEEFQMGMTPARARKKGWIEIDAPGWRGRLYDPRFAEPLNDFYKGIAPATSMIGKTIDRMNRIAVGSLFWTGIGSLAHVRNVAGMRFMARGFGNINPMRLSHAARAFREIQKQGPLYVEALRDGASFPSAGMHSDSLEAHILKTLGHEFTTADPVGLAQAAKKLGMRGVDFAVGIEKGIAKAVFKYGDYLMMQHIIQQMDKGMSLREARLDAEKFLATYRLRSRTGGSGKLARMTTEMLGGQNKLMFGRFERAKATFWYNLIADSIKTVSPLSKMTLQQRIDTVGRVAATIALIALIGPAVINPILQAITKDKNAHVNLGGAAGWMQSALKAADAVKHGRESAGHALFEFFNGLNNIAPIMKEFMQQMSGWRGLDWFTGKPITEGGANVPGLRYARERAEHALKSTIQPFGLLTDPSRMIREPFGISTARPFSDQPRSKGGAVRSLREDQRIRGRLYGGTQ